MGGGIGLFGGRVRIGIGIPGLTRATLGGRSIRSYDQQGPGASVLRAQQPPPPAPVPNPNPRTPSTFRQILPDLIGAAGTLGGAYLNRKAQEDANRATLESIQRQQEFQERLSNTAFSRSAQDVESAGLNRILALNSPASTPGGAHAQLIPEDALGRGLQQTAHSAADLMLKREQLRKMREETRQTRISADAKAIETGYIPGLSQSKIDHTQASTNQAKAQTKHEEYKALHTLQQIKIGDKTYELTKQQVDNHKQQFYKITAEIKETLARTKLHSARLAKEMADAEIYKNYPEWYRAFEQNRGLIPGIFGAIAAMLAGLGGAKLLKGSSPRGKRFDEPNIKGWRKK